MLMGVNLLILAILAALFGGIVDNSWYAAITGILMLVTLGMNSAEDYIPSLAAGVKPWLRHGAIVLFVVACTVALAGIWQERSIACAIFVALTLIGTVIFAIFDKKPGAAT